jgi:hypothetical protein
VAEPTPVEAGLLDLLGAARIARENGKARSRALLSSLEYAIDLAWRRGRMTI